MEKFGLIWKDGRGTRSPKHQKDWLSDAGVPKAKMDTSCPPGREGSETVTCYMDVFGLDPEGSGRRSIRFAIDEYLHYAGNGGSITILEFNKTFSGLDGVRSFLHMWLDRRHKDQTYGARKARGSKPKLKYPKFYTDLSDQQKAKFKQDFEGTTFSSVDEIAKAYGVSRLSIYRTTRKLNLKRPSIGNET